MGERDTRRLDPSPHAPRPVHFDSGANTNTCGCIGYFSRVSATWDEVTCRRCLRTKPAPTDPRPDQVTSPSTKEKVMSEDPQFVRFKLTCEACLDLREYWGNAEGGQTVARSFLRQHQNCQHSFNRSAIPPTDERSTLHRSAGYSEGGGTDFCAKCGALEMTMETMARMWVDKRPRDDHGSLERVATAATIRLAEQVVSAKVDPTTKGD